jgi:hypothetical protein
LTAEGADAARRACNLRAWCAGTALALLAAALHAATHRGEILGGLSDETLLVPLARKAWDGRLYADDAWLALAEQVFSRTYSYLLGAVLRVADDPVVALRLLAFPFHAVFLAGSFRVVERAAGVGRAWAAVVALTFVPLLLGAALAPGAAGPLAASAALPRDLVFALVPWIWIARESVVTGPPRPRLLLFLCVGLLANVHPLTAVHLAAVLLLLEAMRHPLGASLRRAAACAAAVAVGALPYAIQWLRFPRTPGAAPREVLLWRIEGIGADTPALWTGRMEMPVLLVAAACVLGRGRAEPGLHNLRRLALVALVLAALSPLFHAVVPGIQFDRLTRLALWTAIVLLVAEFSFALEARDFGAIAVATALAAVGIGGRAAMRASTGVDRGPFERVARWAERSQSGEGETRPELVPERPRPGDPSLDPARTAAFLDVCAWFRTTTGPVVPPTEWRHPLVAVPPEDFGAFRAYSCCGAVVTRKEGGFALSFLGGRGQQWFDAYRDAVTAWGSRDPAALASWAQARHVPWAVLDAGRRAPEGWSEVHAAGPYRVFRVPAE